MIAVIMAGNSGAYLEMCIKAVEPHVKRIIICYDLNSLDDTKNIVISLKTRLNTKLEVIERAYEHNLKVLCANSDQRNFYLDYLKQNYSGEWCLALDADEVVDEDISKLNQMLSKLGTENILLCNVKMEHFVGDFGHVDNTNETHFVPNRLFKIHSELYYPNGEHPILNTTRQDILRGNLTLFTIYHLAYIPNLKYFKERYLTHMAKSEIHTQQFLQNWYYSHLFGFYPKRDFDYKKIPKIIKDNYLIDDDFFYFMNRNLELKNIIDAAHWREFFKPRNALMVGDGKAIRTTACRLAGIEAYGFDVSQYAVDNNISGFNSAIYWQDDLLTMFTDNRYDLVVAYDVLEHLGEDFIPMALQQLHLFTHKYCLISVPMIGDPNLVNDSSHKVFWTREQWEKAVIEAGFKLVKVPEHFQFRHQLILGEKNG